MNHIYKSASHRHHERCLISQLSTPASPCFTGQTDHHGVLCAAYRLCLKSSSFCPSFFVSLKVLERRSHEITSHRWEEHFLFSMCELHTLSAPPTSRKTLFTLIVCQKWIAFREDEETCSIMWNDTNI